MSYCIYHDQQGASHTEIQLLSPLPSPSRTSFFFLGSETHEIKKEGKGTEPVEYISHGAHSGLPYSHPMPKAPLFPFLTHSWGRNRRRNGGAEGV